VLEHPEGAVPPPAAVLPVTKSWHNPYSNRISVGRSRSNDIILLSPQVSKVHAFILPGSDGSYDLRDAGSSNGTFLRGRRLRPDERMQLAIGEPIRFGVLDTLFLDAGRLHDWLNRQPAR
jgi:pSer/pThr/pTyr-binding forkhead associated (FHA) protein